MNQLFYLLGFWKKKSKITATY